MNGDDLITLDEALAFIGFCDEETHVEGASLSAQVQDIHDAFMLDGIDELLDAAVTALAPITAKTPSLKHNLSSSELQLASPPRKKRLRSAGSSSTVMQRRKKHEIETLREESSKLEALAFTVNNSAMLMNQLEEEVDDVYRNFRRVCRPQLASMLHSTSETTYDEKCESNAMEFVTTTPLDWSMRAAFNHVWAFLDSSSVPEDDTLVSLEEALAFIDGSDISDESLTDTLIHCSPMELFSQITPSELSPPKAPATTTRKRFQAQRNLAESSSSQNEKSTKKRRIRSAASSSTRLQQRKRAEIQALREQAQELEAQVELLKKNKFLPGDVGLELDGQPTGDSGALVNQQKQPANWHEMAIAQYRERLWTSTEALGAQRHGLRVLDESGMDTTTLLSAGDSSDVRPSEVNKNVVAELEQVVQRMYKEDKFQSKVNKPTPAISCDMRIKHDARRGKMVEFVTTTPMSCSLEDATEIVWKELTTYREYPDKVYKCVRDKTNSQAKNFVMSLKSPSGTLELNGVQYMEKFEEMDQTIFAVAERMVLPTKSIQYRDECWMTVAPSASDSSVSIVEIFLQLFMERDDGLVACPEDLAYAQNIVMGSLSNTLRKFFQAQQNALMEKAGRVIVAPIDAPGAIL
ncbi:hypothetical protein GQ600_18388 [Phytophthora cactorum]|nr:hypothetical protein GQ600_18388 [Phytophthora cactorum]